MPNQSGLQRSNIDRTNKAREKALQTVNELKAEGMKVNFSTVSQRSGISRHFLYEDPETRRIIEEHRRNDVNNEINKRAKFDQTAKSKDVIIAAKDRRIARLEEEKKKLQVEVIALRGEIYNK
ncbi:MAG: transposase [Blautia sp.]|nr:transposase [Blautia sp.]